MCVSTRPKPFQHNFTHLSLNSLSSPVTYNKENSREPQNMVQDSLSIFQTTIASHIYTQTLSPSHVLPAAAAGSPVRWRCFVPAAPCCPSAPQSFSHSPVAERWGRSPAAGLYLSLLSEQQAEEQENQEWGNEEWGAWRERNGGGRREKGEGRWEEI